MLLAVLFLLRKLYHQFVPDGCDTCERGRYSFFMIVCLRFSKSSRLRRCNCSRLQQVSEKTPFSTSLVFIAFCSRQEDGQRRPLRDSESCQTFASQESVSDLEDRARILRLCFCVKLHACGKRSSAEEHHCEFYVPQSRPSYRSRYVI
jgi:hypothetical protein